MQYLFASYNAGHLSSSTKIECTHCKWSPYIWKKKRSLSALASKYLLLEDCLKHSEIYLELSLITAEFQFIWTLFHSQWFSPFQSVHICSVQLRRMYWYNRLGFCICRVTSSMTGSAWLTYSYATFEIYSKNADDGTPVQYGDVVGFKYPYSSNSAWLTKFGRYFYPRSCSSSSKTSCAAENTWTGFKIFKKLS